MLVFKEVLSRCAEAGLLRGDALLVQYQVVSPNRVTFRFWLTGFRPNKLDMH